MPHSPSGSNDGLSVWRLFEKVADEVWLKRRMTGKWLFFDVFFCELADLS